ncbi:hypothetical protein [uncultured Litoreibacter sp.]|uniref:hypothetical protein n=1 Tax=uncultured Litoreibacter sp. TaxID=1392394 RepID=UPI00263351D5|nr:hypothetical protein [uncultured Litoreibacter sp.]
MAQQHPRKTFALRDPNTVMRLERLGSFHQSRLSFMRILTRRMAAQGWTFTRPEFAVDARGVGHAVYCAHTPERSYSLVAFAHDLPADQRSDRVIAQAWDSTFTLFDGVPTQDDIERLRQNIPVQEAGRVRRSELSVSRANRSVRLWEHVVSRLAQGQQPDQAMIAQVGYLMRTTAVYGSGKLGAADREATAARPEFAAPFQIEMLSVFLTRAFVRDLVQHMAQMRGGDAAVQLDRSIARSIGIGNSTGLGMAPFLLNHPTLFHNWIAARETALARVRAVRKASSQEVAMFQDLVARVILSADQWQSAHPIQIDKLTALRGDLARLSRHLERADLSQDHPWDGLFDWAAAQLGIDAQECLASVMLEPYGALVDDLCAQMSDDEVGPVSIDGAMTVGALRDILARDYAWAMTIDWADKACCARAWYVSEEKLEPRLGERFSEPIAPYEQPLAPGRDASALFDALREWGADTSLAEFLRAHPAHRHMVRRTQIVDRAPYAEIRDNTISAALLPIDMLRCKLSFFGATHFDPRSDRWVRICLFGNAPYPEELCVRNADDWVYPPLDARGA